MYYNPAVPPSTKEDLLVYLNEEFFRVSISYNPILEGLYEIHYKAPTKVQPGMVRYFSGPASPLGTGLEGLYRYSLAGVWVYIG
jgi:hypothetical protein